MDREAAAEELAKVLFRVGIKEGLTTFFELLNNPLGQDKQKWEQAKKWYESQGEEQKKLLRFLVKRAMITSVFGIAVHLDGAEGYERVRGKPGEFVVTLNLYEDIEQIGEVPPEASVRVCPAEGEDIHDILLYFVDEAKDLE